VDGVIREGIEKRGVMPRKRSDTPMGHRCPIVTVHTLDSFGFQTVGPTASIWAAAFNRVPGVGIDFEHAAWKHVRFVRLQPAAEMTEDTIAFMRREIEAKGIDVQVLMPQEPQVVLEQATPVYEDKGIRETVTVMAEESNSRNKPALWALLEATMAEVGL
jgi:hypothetical protein